MPVDGTLAPPPGREGSRTEKVYKTLLSWIQDGRIPFEGKLPTENELSHQFEVSRPVVRAAIARLREKGMVRSVQGSGTIVIWGGSAGGGIAGEIRKAGLQSSVRDLQRCFEYRLLIESEAAYYAALRHSPAALERIAARVYPPTYSFSASEPEPYERFDFHRAVVLAADNVFLERSMDMFVSQPGFQYYLRMSGLRALSPAEHRATVNSEHMEILRLIERRQAVDAREYMRYHIQKAYDNLTENISIIPDQGSASRAS
jgi:GntR family transcriptional regulator, transcriptional repressor for pyruvate dehydrogenase complex